MCSEYHNPEKGTSLGAAIISNLSHGYSMAIDTNLGSNEEMKGELYTHTAGIVYKLQ